ncbi:GH25 family lysozyme [Mesorhizobium sp.]|uniref:GH25 family lysozyme n=1 Tax=Mesorhizobium sp. TaxID=1871066 RepID=UPI000FE65C4F|nr:GH25 family lysozyme [Mesorhizobium sp.]RWA70567.1 MAG: glycoside hydrolase [Mesorhizobium sp.]RWA83482.1 MAG: glycoside hydrolase [Mesorhizobium sp.]
MKRSFFRSVLLAAILCQTGALNIANAQDTLSESSWNDLSDDVSRSTLFADEIIPARLLDDEKNPNAPASFNLPKEFFFPDDAKTDKALGKPRKDAIFGIDVSHWTGNIKFKNLALQRVLFVYAKATQGVGFKDAMFTKYWDDLALLKGEAKVYRGAYHFLTANEDAQAQAKSFVDYLALHGGIKPDDMPPCLDLEWDRTSTNPDRWTGQAPDKIIEKARKWLEMVEQKTGRTPVLYTAKSWWKARGIDEGKLAALSRYHVWIADYSVSHKAAEKPSIINGKTQKLWQFADDAFLSTGYTKGLDANIYYGTPQAFEQDFGISK